MTINRRAFIQKSAAASFAGALSLPAFAAEQTLKYGGSPWLGHYPAHLAMAEGYLKEVGITQDWQSFATSSARMSAFMSGGVDIGCAGIVSALSRHCLGIGADVARCQAVRHHCDPGKLWPR